jgi:hypothetical protein
MKSLILALVALFSLGQAQIVLDGGRTQWGKTVRWGDTDDSTSSIRFRGNTLARDSSSTWVTTTDSCSLPVKLGFTSLPDSKMELSYDVRASSGNTDSTQALIYVDSRYCLGSNEGSCEDWVQAGRFRPDSTSRIQDLIYTYPTTSGVTWMPTRHIFDVPGGNQIRFCIDAYEMGGATGDTTFFRSHIVRNSAIPAGGVPAGSAGGGASGTVDLTGINGVTPSTGNGTAGTGTIRVAVASNNTAFTVNAAQSGTWTVQPGNTANTTAWLVDGTGGTFPATQSGTWNVNNVSGTVNLPTGAATAAKQPALGTAGTPSADVISIQGVASGTVVPVSDGSGSLTVDNAGTFATQAAQSGTWTVQPGNTANTTAWLVTGTGGTFPTSGVAAHGAAVSGSPVLVGFEARTSNGTAVDNGDVIRMQATIEGKAVTQPYSVRGATWSYAAASGGIVNTTGVTIVAAAGSSVRNCVTSVDIENGHATVSTEVVLRDGASGTVLKRWWTQAAGGGIAKTLPVPVCGSANTLLEVAAITTGSAIYVNAEGYTTQE